MEGMDTDKDEVVDLQDEGTIELCHLLCVENGCDGCWGPLRFRVVPIVLDLVVV